MKYNIRRILTGRISLLIMALLLLGLSVVLQHYFSPRTGISNDHQKLEAYLHKQQEDFYSLMNDTSLLQKLVQRTESLEEFQYVQQLSCGVFIYAESVNDYQMVFWNNKLVIPEQENFNLPDGMYFQSLDNGDYVAIKKSFVLPGMTNRLVVFGMLPVRFHYFIETDITYETFAFSQNMTDRLQIVDHVTNYPVKSLEGKILFYVDALKNGQTSSNDNIAMAFRISALILLLMFFHFTAEKIVRKKGSWQGIAFLASTLILTRLLILIFPALFNLNQYELFNSGKEPPNDSISLGDLLINALIFCWIVVFAWAKSGNIQWSINYKNNTRWILGSLALLTLIVSTFIVADVIRNLVSDSKISFDVTDFFSLSIYSVIGFTVLASLSLGYYYFTQLLLRFILPIFDGRRVIIYFAIAVTGLLYITVLAPATLVFYHL